MNFNEAMRKLGHSTTPAEALAAIRAEHGRGASRRVADALGVSTRQARRYLAGDVKAPPAARAEALRSAAGEHHVAAARLRTVRNVNAGRVPVIAKSPNSPDGTRRIGMIRASEIQGDLDRAADALQNGDPNAEAIFSDAILNQYGKDRQRDGRNYNLGDYLSIGDYDGIEFD